MSFAIICVIKKTIYKFNAIIITVKLSSDFQNIDVKVLKEVILYLLRQAEHGHFWATVCETVRPMLSDRCPICHVLSVCL